VARDLEAAVRDYGYPHLRDKHRFPAYSVAFGSKAQLSNRWCCIISMFRPRRYPDPALNPKFEHKLRFLDEMKACEPLHPRGDDRHILVGDLNVAPHENDVWSHKQLLKVVSHTPIECEKLLAAQTQGEWIDVARERIPLSEKVYTWWSYRAADWTLADAAAGSITSGVARPQRGCQRFRITGMRAAGNVRPTTCRVTVTLGGVDAGSVSVSSSCGAASRASRRMRPHLMVRDPQDVAPHHRITRSYGVSSNVIRSILFEHDLFGKPVSTHRVVAEGMLFRIMP